ncbi:hypothetical protein C7999DRAFT_30642 [Corynascus novoguineensis]|uniref:Uncharacterized protein n=1 Tax=Corynascus novoguineensis TaxID=1126955 RepID=A0AAN7CV38_9PEZI|nr:hypothetical protein C7999DRAFT_30642 [Corynascus novoguineensis]
MDMAKIDGRTLPDQEDEDYTEVEIRSPHMKAALKAIIPEYRTAGINTRHIILRDETRPIFHYGDELIC